MVRAITFDPETLENLIDQCPDCGGKLSWVKNANLDHCEHCNASLTDHDPGRVEPEIAASARAAADIVDPDTAIRKMAIESLPERFKDWEAGDVFSMLVELGEAKVLRKQGLTGPAKYRIGNGDFTGFDAVTLAAGYDFIKAWPQSFADYVADTPKPADGGEPGFRDLFGSLYRHFHAREVVTVIGAELRRERPLALARGGYFARTRITAEIAESANICTGRSIAIKNGIDWKRVQRIVATSSSVLAKNGDATGDYVIFDREMIERSISIYRSSRLAEDTFGVIGIPLYCVEAMADVGLVVRVTDNDALTMGGGRPRYDLESVDALWDQFTDSKHIPQEALKLSTALNGRIHPADWAMSLKAVIDGRLPLMGFRHVGKLYDRVMVDPDELDIILRDEVERRPFICDDVSMNGAARALGVAGKVLADATRIGLLETTQRRQFPVLSFAELDRFNSAYMLGAEVRVKLGGGHLRIADAKDEFDIEPAAMLGNVPLWHRGDAETLITARQDRRAKRFGRH